VQPLHGAGDLLDNLPCLMLWQFAIFCIFPEVVIEITVFAELEDQIVVVCGALAVNEPDDTGMVKLLEDVNFFFNHLLMLCFEMLLLDHLDGNVLVGGLVLALVDSSKRPESDFLLQRISPDFLEVSLFHL
jgi:hypothetical protein